MSGVVCGQGPRQPSRHACLAPTERPCSCCSLTASAGLPAACQLPTACSYKLVGLDINYEDGLEDAAAAASWAQGMAALVAALKAWRPSLLVTVAPFGLVWPAYRQLLQVGVGACRGRHARLLSWRHGSQLWLAGRRRARTPAAHRASRSMPWLDPSSAAGGRRRRLYSVAALC